MIHLSYSNQLEALLDAFNSRLKRSDPFLTPVVAVPNRNLRMWINLQLARSGGIAANIRYERLDQVLMQIAAPAGSAELSDTVLRMMVIRLLNDYTRADDAIFDPLKRYLDARNPIDRDIRTYQLARRLVSLFREYSFSRMEMTRLWEQGGSRFPDGHPIEAWQRRMWNDLFGSSGLLARRNAGEDRQALIPVHQLGPPLVRLKHPIHIFGVSYVSRFHQHLLKQLGDRGDLHIYVLNPCRVFWEDMKTPREARHVAAEEIARGELHPLEHENPLLAAWGKPGREYMHLLNDLSGWDFQDLFVETPTNKRQLLQHIQADILDRQIPDEAISNVGPDHSLRILGCPSPRREAEIVAGSIWDLLLAHRDITLQDIAVIVSDMATYQTEIESAFQRHYHLPFNLVDGAVGRASRLIEAVRCLLDLPDSRFDRDSLFQLYRHPNFRARFPNADPEAWLQLADDLAIFHGRDRRAQQAYLEKDLYNWDQGVTRLLLGSYIHGDDQPLYQSGRQSYLVHPLSGSESGAAHLFTTVTQSILADCGELHSLKLSAADWAEYFRQLFTTYLAPCEGEDADFERVCRAASRINDLAEALENELEKLSFATVRAFIQDELRKLTPFYGQYLADGVTVSSFMPMRPIPFKAVFVMGLDESRFPRPAAHDTLDLRWVPVPTQTSDGFTHTRERRIGDVNDRERDRYMFLETFVATREILTLSYVDRDDRTGDQLNPSSVLTELYHLARRYQPNFEIIRHPLKNYSHEYHFLAQDGSAGLVSHDPFAARLNEVRRNRESMLEQTGGKVPTDFRAVIPSEHRGKLGLSSPVFPGLEEDGVIKISLSQIRDFLTCPLQATAKRALRLRDEEEDLAEKSDEPFGLSPLIQSNLLNGVMEDVLAQHAGDFSEIPHLDDVLDQVSQAAELRGQMPSGLFYSLIRDHLRETLDQWRNGLQRLELEGGAARLRFAKQAAVSENNHLLPPIQLQIDMGGQIAPVEITGSTQYLFGQDSDPHLVTFCTRKEALTNAKWARYFLRPFIDSIAFSAARHHYDIRTSVIGVESRQASRQTQIQYIKAQAWLSGVVQDMLTKAHDYLLPIEWAVKLHKNKGKAVSDPATQYERLHLEGVDTHNGESSRYGPIVNWYDYPAYEDISALIERRYQLFYDYLDLPEAVTA